MLASDFKLGKLKLPVFGEEDGVPFPRFNIEHATDEMEVEFVSYVEQETREIRGDISDREYLARRLIACTMPRLNRVFEELGIHYADRKVLAKVQKFIEDKNRRDTMAKNMTALAESKKRKGGAATKTISKKQKGAAISNAASINSAGGGSGQGHRGLRSQRRR